MPEEQKTATVIFDMWGQRCETVFNSTSELDPLTWIRLMYSKGWLRPVQIVGEHGIILYTQGNLLEGCKEL